jgi:transcriptional regulator with XRE-family HTH domain
MIAISFGQRIHELRDKADLSLRGLAKRIGISSAFLSDIELGRRFPSEKILAKVAGALEVSADELKLYDTREPIADLKRLMDADPKLGLCVQNGCGKGKERRTDCRRYNR